MFEQDAIATFLGSWSAQLNFSSVVLRMALAVVMGAIIGCERSSKRHSAGLRTFVLVAFGSAGAMLLDLYWMQRTGFGMPLLSAATVMAAALVSIKSILFSSRNQIKGLTTSAGLWTCSILGFTAGAGLYTVTLLEFVFLLCILAGFPAFERYLKNRSNHFEMHIELKSRSDLQDFITTVRTLGLKIDDIEANPAYLNSGLSVYSVSLTVRHRDAGRYRSHAELIAALCTLDCVYYAEEIG